MKYKGRSESDIHEEDLPKEVQLEEEIVVEEIVKQAIDDDVNEFKEVEMEAGDQSMPSRPQPSKRPQSSKPKVAAKPKPEQSKVVPEPPL